MVRYRLSGYLCMTLFLISIPVHAMIQGHVIDSSQNPIAGARVTFTEESSPYTSYSAVTDESGWYQIDFSVSVSEEAPVPFSLGQNYPNPFNPSTTIPFSLDTASHVSLTIYNIMGQNIATVIDHSMSAGSHTARWNGLDTTGRHVSAGIYFYRLKAGRHVETRKMLLLDGGGGSGNGAFLSAKPVNGTEKIAEGTTYTVNITHDYISYYKETGIALNDGEMKDFVVIAHNIRFVSIPGGTFEMGDEVGDLPEQCRPVHTVTVSDFEMGICEVTNAQYAEYLTAALASGDITATNSNATGVTGDWAGEEYFNLSDLHCEISYSEGTFSVDTGKENRPVHCVTWYGAKSFANYYGFDLPTEAEWEYACRGGQQYLFGTYDGTLDNSKANWNIGDTTDVGSYPANPFGLYDMSGNVWEWCHDWYGDYTSESENNPKGAHAGYRRVFRGGVFCCNYTFVCRSANRYGIHPHSASSHMGFRVVRRPGGTIVTNDINRIDGRVQFNDSGLQDVRVCYFDRWVNTKSDGTYVFTGLPDGTYTIKFAKDGFNFSPESVEVTLRGNDVIVDEVQATEKIIQTDVSFVSIPGGTFEMGDEIGDLPDYCRPVYTVTLSDFDMGIYEVTNAQYAEYLTAALASGDITVSSSSIKGATGNWRGMEYLYLERRDCEITYNGSEFLVNFNKEHLPVIWVTWYGAKSYANFYGFDLPTEAEWEYACRGGKQYLYGTDDGTIDRSKVNYFSLVNPHRNIGRATDVGRYPANPFGLYDMSGNVWEWCNDWYGVYTSEDKNNPTGPRSGSKRVTRGGGSNNPDSNCRSALHQYSDPGAYGQSLGFRVVHRPNGLIY